MRKQAIAKERYDHLVKEAADHMLEGDRCRSDGDVAGFKTAWKKAHVEYLEAAQIASDNGLDAELVKFAGKRSCNAIIGCNASSDGQLEEAIRAATAVIQNLGIPSYDPRFMAKEFMRQWIRAGRGVSARKDQPAT
ncbi:MAG: hypothetical protein M1504_02605 [Candidatus Marsarchaeota archaeon]|nr:hypothetical protein [Candidatus Marsarchaeota archaeon]